MQKEENQEFLSFGEGQYEEFEEFEEHEEWEEKEEISDSERDYGKVYITQVSEDEITQFKQQENKFFDHLLYLQDTSKLINVEFQMVKRTQFFDILSTQPSGFTLKYKLMSQIKQQLDNLYIRQIRKQLDAENNEFDELLTQAILSRQSVLVTSNSFQLRQQFREISAACIVSYLLQKYSLIAIYAQDKLQRIANQYQTNTKNQQAQLLLNNQEETSNQQADILDNSYDLQCMNDQILHNERHFNGFSRQQVLVLTETRHAAWRIISNIIGCLPKIQKKNIGNLKRFERIFAPDEETNQYTVEGMSLIADEVPDKYAKTIDTKKPIQWHQHYCGSLQNDFIITLSIHKKGPHGILMFSDITKADIIITSPKTLLQTIIRENDRYRGYLKNINSEVVQEQIKEDPKLEKSQYKKQSLKQKQEYNLRQKQFKIPFDSKSLLSSLHTIMIDSIDYLIDSQYSQLKQILRLLFQLPKKLENVDIRTLSPLFLNQTQSTGCQFLVFQSYESSITNYLFKDKVQHFPESKQLQGDAYINSIVYSAKQEDSKDNNLDFRINMNSMGLCRIKTNQPKIEYLDNFKTIIANQRQQNNILTRKTDMIIGSQLQFDIKKDAKVDIMMNKLLDETSDAQTVIFCQNIFQAKKIESCFTKLEKDFILLTEELEAKEIGPSFAHFQQNEDCTLVITQSFMFQRMLILKSKHLILLGCPEQPAVLNWLLTFRQGSAIMLISLPNDIINLENNFSTEIIEKMINNNQWVW